MKNSFFYRCFMTLGLILFLSIVPFPMTASAAQVYETQSDIKLNVKSIALVKDTSYELKVYNISDSQKVTFKTNNSDVAEVNEDGKISAIDFGSALITVTVKDGYKTIATLDCVVTVGPSAFSIKLTKSEITLAVGGKTNLTAILKPNNTVEEAKFSSNDPSIASVSIGGKVTAKVVGVTYVFASIDNGKFDLCKVTVVESGLDDSTED
ncbi:MAG: Ig domain protein group 2 domain protein [Anaerocolumna sp.]|nr:Ig domain protein group 2 domain protein [Anaerocolumna sp.]